MNTLAIGDLRFHDLGIELRAVDIDLNRQLAVLVGLVRTSEHQESHVFLARLLSNGETGLAAHEHGYEGYDGDKCFFHFFTSSII